MSASSHNAILYPAPPTVGELPGSVEGSNTRSVGLVLLAGVLWSTAGLGVRLMEGAGPWQIMLYRSLFLLPAVFLLLAVTSEAPLLRTIRGIGRTGIIGSLCLAGSSVMYILSLTHTTVANTVFLVSTAPFMTALLAWVVLGERVMRVTWIAMAVATAGILIMLGDGLSSGDWRGNVAALLAAAGFACVTVALRSGRTVNMIPMLAIGALWTALVAAVAIVLSGASFAVPLIDLSLCLNMAVVQMGFGGLCYTLGSRTVSAAELTLLSLSEVILGPLWVWLAVNETPAVATLVGGSIVLCALAGRAIHGIRRRPPMRVF